MKGKFSKILIIAGSDSGGGAGIQADIKTVTALGGYATTAITALTAQNTMGVTGIHAVPANFVSEQMEAVICDIGCEAIKTGMMHNQEIIKAVAESMKKHHLNIPIVVDPVMVAKGGAKLLADDARNELIESLLPLASLVTPNIPEAEILADMKIHNAEQMEKAGKKILKLGARAVLVKGGHLETNEMVDILVNNEMTRRYASKRIATKNTHGTGCTLASAIATLLAQKYTLGEAVKIAQKFVHEAIKNAIPIGSGHGPVRQVRSA